MANTITTHIPNQVYYGNIISNTISSQGTIFSAPPYSNNAPLSITGINGSEIVRINKDGTVTWANGIQIDEAAEAFSKSLTYSAELKAGISKKVKLEMRDTVFEELIKIAKLKGSLSADDLTYLLEASKIIEKLKGVTE